MKNFDEIFTLIELAFKKGDLEICPKCGNRTETYPNPFYIHICDKCKEQYYIGTVKKVTVKEVVKNILKDNYEI